MEQEIFTDIGVCLASMSFYPLYAGPAVRFQRYAPGLGKRGIQMRVFTQAVTGDLVARDGSLANNGETNPGPQLQGKGAWPLFETVGGLPIQRIELPTGWRRHPAYFGGLANYCQKQRSEIDLVQFLNLDIWAIPGLRQLRRLGISTVLTHTLLGDFSSNPWRQIWQRFHRRLPFNLVGCVVVSSNTMRRQLEDLGVSVPIHVIPNGVDLQRFRPIEKDKKIYLRQKLGLDLSWDIILAIGPITPRKGTEVLIEAFVSLCHEQPKAHLVLVGPRHDLNRDTLVDFRQRLQGAITAANAQNRVTFTGAVSNIQEYLQAADILVFPSRREGMPNVVPEAMACGLPVIMTPFIGLPDEFGRPEIHYILSDWETEVLAADIRTLLTNPTRRHHLGRSAREWIEQNLDINQALDAYAELYRYLKTRRASVNQV